MQNLTDTETLLFVGFFILCACVIFMVSLCLKHGCLYRLRHKETHAGEAEPSFSVRLHRPSSVLAPLQPIDKKQAPVIWVDSSLQEERPKAFQNRT